MFDLSSFENVINRDPDFIIGTESSIYLKRWWLIPRNKIFNVYLHQFLRDDDDRALHDHPWDSFSFVISGTGREVTQKESCTIENGFGPGDTFFRSAEYAHRIELIDSPVWTLFVTGPTIREWGFHCPQGWRHWKEFCDSRDSGKVGRGCD